jgi:hypothetical protein
MGQEHDEQSQKKLAAKLRHLLSPLKPCADDAPASMLHLQFCGSQRSEKFVWECVVPKSSGLSDNCVPWTISGNT